MTISKTMMSFDTATQPCIASSVCRPLSMWATTSSDSVIVWVSREAGELGSEVTTAILDVLADAHMKLSEGQGAELAWRDSSEKALQPIDAMKIYALKTSPAFEAALATGAALAGKLNELRKPMKLFARNIGVAFQILNDLKDWERRQRQQAEVGR